MSPFPVDFRASLGRGLALILSCGSRRRFIAKSLAANLGGQRVRSRCLCGAAAAAGASSSIRGPNHGQEGQCSGTGVAQYDVAVVGGGMVGMALACSLASMPLTKNLNIAIIDSNPALVNGIRINKEDPPDPRVSTITPATISMFRDIGAWQYLQQYRHAYFDKMQVWDYTGLGYTRYHARDVDKDSLGCVVENKVLQSSLLLCIQNADIQKKIFPSRLVSMSLNPGLKSKRMDGISPEISRGDLTKLQLNDGTCLYAKLVVGADGSKSQVRELAGFKTTGWNYSQNAIICTVEHASENRCAWQRFLPAGPIALLPVGDNFSNIVWTMNPKEALDRKSMTEADFVKTVNHALDHGFGPHPTSSLLGNGNFFSWFRAGVVTSGNGGFEIPPKVLKLASERMVFPLSLRHANDYVSKHVALIGDAAHTVHPLAGQGVNLGFGDAFALSRVIGEAIAVGMDIGEVSLLKKYEAERKPANIAMMAILDGFQKAYSVDFGPLNILRAAGLHAANYISPLKRSIISYASGEQRLPLFS